MYRSYLMWLLLLALSATTSSHAKLRLVVLDPGHGGPENKGAPALMRPGTYEKHYTLPLSHAVKRHLEAAGVQVRMTRTADTELGLTDRVQIANAMGADAFISLHLNSTDKPGPEGHASYFLAPEASDEATRRLVEFENHDPKTIRKSANKLPAEGVVTDILLDMTRHRAQYDSRRLAELIQDRIGRTSPYDNRGVKQAPFAVLKGTAMPAVVCEIGFINHPKEGIYITSKAGLENIGAAIAKGILDFGELVHDTRTQQRGKKK